MLSSLYSRRKREDGFTLIELLVVVIIIGILAAIALPIFINQQKLAVEASVKSDVRNTVTNVNNWLVDHRGSAATTQQYLDGGGKLALSRGSFVRLSLAADGAYTVCGYNPGAVTSNSAGSAWGFDASTGRFTAFGATCDGALDTLRAVDPDPATNGTPAGGSGPGGGTGGGGTPNTGDGITDPYANDPGNVTIRPVATDVYVASHSSGQAGFEVRTTRVATGKVGATVHGVNFFDLDGATSTNTPYVKQNQYNDLHVKFYNAAGEEFTNYGGNCETASGVYGKPWLVSSGVNASATSDEYEVTLNCGSGGFISPIGGWMDSSSVGSVLKGGYYTFTDNNGVNRVDISATANFHS